MTSANEKEEMANITIYRKSDLYAVQGPEDTILYWIHTGADGVGIREHSSTELTITYDPNVGPQRSWKGLASEVLGEDGLAYGSTNLDVTKGLNTGLDVVIQDQHSKIVIAKLSTLDSEDTLAIAASVDDVIINLVDASSFSSGQFLSMFDPISNNFYLAHILSINVNEVTVDTPLDFAYPIGSFVTGGQTNMAVDGSVTPVLFGLRNTDATIGDSFDVTRIILSCLTVNAPAFDEFGDIAGGLTKGIVLRKVDGVHNNIFNIKTNGELAGIMFDFASADAVNPNQGQNGFIARMSFAGTHKMGVSIRLDPGDDLCFIVQDNLTTIQSLELVVEGHIVKF